ncbi:MAG: hypothetical protein R6W86_09830 [Marinobacter sp.]
MKRIAICFGGTWNRPEENTVIAKSISLWIKVDRNSGSVSQLVLFSSE